jgi:hypothetical protein
VTRVRQAKDDPFYAADALRALVKGEESETAEIGWLLVARFFTR